MSDDLFNLFLGVAPMLLLIGAWFFFMRRMSRPDAPITRHDMLLERQAVALERIAAALEKRSS